MNASGDKSFARESVGWLDVQFSTKYSAYLHDKTADITGILTSDSSSDVVMVLGFLSLLGVCFSNVYFIDTGVERNVFELWYIIGAGFVFM